MARIARDIYNKKIETALTAFKASPEPAVKAVNAAIFQEFGGYMNLADIYLTREIARTGGTAEDFYKAQTTAKIAAKARKVQEVIAEPVQDCPVIEVVNTAEPVPSEVESVGLV